MANYTYETLLNDNVQFLQGTQSALNDFLPSSSSNKRGTAVEGAFYLTTDTHRLYVGRKVTTGTDQNKVFPEEVSTGIATVVDSGELADAQTGGAAHDGDFYYIKSTNVLAVYKDNGNGTGQWIQINSPTGISSYSHSIASNNHAVSSWENETNQVRIHSEIGTAGGSQTSDFYIKAGDNVTLKPSADNSTVEISSANSQSDLKIETSNATTNKAPVVLSDGVNLDTKVHFVGKNDTTAAASYNYKTSVDTSVVSGKEYYTRTGTDPNFTYTLVTNPTGNPSTSNYYERENIVTIAGPYVKGTKISAQGNSSTHTGTTHGFSVAVQVKDGDTTNESTRTYDNYSKLDPTITVGKDTSSQVYFYGGDAKLDVYTSGEVDSKINDAIEGALQTADALHYKGTVGSTSALSSKTNVEKGDVYKASADFTYSNQSVKTGDLLIAQGSEGTDGYIPSNSLTWDIIPSGDEPLLKARINATNSGNPYFGLEDEHIAGDYSTLDATGKLNKRPLNVTFDNTNSTLIQAKSSGTADDFKITLHHKAPVSNNNTNVTTVTSSTVKASSGTDSLSTKDQVATFTALKTLTRDPYGHIVDVAGETITLQHNYLTKLSASHSVSSNVGTITLGAEDKLGITQTTGALTKGSIKIGSDTLNITADGSNTQLNVNLVWKNF